MSDKRKVSTDALETLGTIIDESAARDAIHLAVEPVIAGQKLYPGQDIGIVEGKATIQAEKKIGIVDPFIKGFVPEGAKFWLIVYPRQITSLRHVWSHPDFEDSKEVESLIDHSEKWIRDFAARVGLKYDILMDGADTWVRSRERDSYGEYLCFGSLLEGEYVPDEFWTHYEIVRGVKVNEDYKESFFTCSC